MTYLSKLGRRNGLMVYLVAEHPDGTRTVGVWRRLPEGKEWVEWVEPIPQTEKQS